MARFLYAANWDLHKELQMNELWRIRVKNLIADEVAFIRQITAIDSQEYCDDAIRYSYKMRKKGKIDQDLDSVEYLTKNVYNQRMATKIYAWARRDCISGCSDYHIRRDGVDGNNSQYKEKYTYTSQI